MYTYMSIDKEAGSSIYNLKAKGIAWSIYDGAGCALIGNITTLAENACLNLNVY